MLSRNWDYLVAGSALFLQEPVIEGKPHSQDSLLLKSRSEGTK